MNLLVNLNWISQRLHTSVLVYSSYLIIFKWYTIVVFKDDGGRDQWYVLVNGLIILRISVFN